MHFFTESVLGFPTYPNPESFNRISPCVVVVYTNAGPLKTGVWLLLSAAMAVGLIYSLSEITIKFMSYPSSVGIIIENANDVQFPAVTLCNLSPVRASRYNEILLGSAATRRKRSTAEGTTTELNILSRVNTSN